MRSPVTSGTELPSLGPRRGRGGRGLRPLLRQRRGECRAGAWAGFGKPRPEGQGERKRCPGVCLPVCTWCAFPCADPQVCGRRRPGPRAHGTWAPQATRCPRHPAPGRPRPPPRGARGRWRQQRVNAGRWAAWPGAGLGAASCGRAQRTCHLQRARRVQGAERVAGAQAGPLHHVVVRAAEEPVLAQRELVARDELAAAGHAAEALDVVHLGAGAHHEVVLAEADAALGAFDPVQPGRAGPGRGEAQGSGHLGGYCPV